MNISINDALKAEILENAPAHIAFHDTGQNIVWANRAYRETTGWALEKPDRVKCWVAWGLKESCRNCPVTRALQTGEPAEAELTPENQENWLETQGSWLAKAEPIKAADGRIIGAVENVFEITKRKKTEQAPRESEDLLRRRNSVLEGINRIFHEVLTCESDKEVGRTCLANKPGGYDQFDLETARDVSLAVTEALFRKRTDRIMRESEEKFSKAFHNSPSFMAISKIEDGSFVEVNNAFCELTGCYVSE